MSSPTRPGPPADDAKTRRDEARHRRRERITALVLITLWCLLLLAGTVVNSSPYWQSISPAGDQGIAIPRDVDRWRWAWVWFVTITCYTVSNVFMLTVVAGMLGGLGRTLRTDPSEAHVPSLSDVLIAGALQGFFAYVLIIAGFLFTVADNGFLATSQAQYVRLAGLASAFGFVLGYEPSTFRRMLGGVRDRLVRPRGNGDANGGAPAPGADTPATPPGPTPASAPLASPTTPPSPSASPGAPPGASPGRPPPP